MLATEVPTPLQEGGAGHLRLDHLFVDTQAVPTFVEVKRSTDTRSRREVVAQMLDYAANGTRYWPLPTLQRLFEEEWQPSGKSSAEALSKHLGADGDPEAFWKDLESNLRSGRVRLLFLADEIAPELQRIVEFLNEQMRPAEVLAVEVRQYQGEGHTAYVPRRIGATAAAKDRKAATERWTEERFLEAGEAVGGTSLRTGMERFLQWGRARGGREVWGSGAARGSVQFPFKTSSGEIWPLSLLSSGWLMVPFQAYGSRPPFDTKELRDEYATRLGDVPGLAVPADADGRYPEISARQALSDEDATQVLLDVLDWFVDQLGHAKSS